MSATIIKQYKLNYFDPSVNSNKVWIGLAYADGTFETRFGRVRDGSRLSSKSKKLSSASVAEIELERLRREKLRKGYRDCVALDETSEIKTGVAKAEDLSKIAADQIGGADDTVTGELIKYLAEVNIHHITQATSIRYDAANATFSTPLGILTTDAIEKARYLLGRIEKQNTAAVKSTIRYELVRDYFQLVPKDFGVRVPAAEELLASPKHIIEESAILDALSAALQTAAPSSETSNLFECSLQKVPHYTEDGKNTFRQIKALFEKTRNTAHHGSVAKLTLTRLYKVEIPSMKSAFEVSSKKLGNVREDLWHGTRASNLLAILKNGLIIPPSSASHCTGRMFGNGIYTSLQSTKALNYATDFWNRSGRSGQRTFMFLCSAALGKTYKPRSSGSNFPAAGTDSTWVEAGSAGVMNHECIVYRPEQINLRYLCEFGTV